MNAEEAVRRSCDIEYKPDQAREGGGWRLGGSTCGVVENAEDSARHRGLGQRWRERGGWDLLAMDDGRAPLGLHADERAGGGAEHGVLGGGDEAADGELGDEGREVQARNAEGEGPDGARVDELLHRSRWPAEAAGAAAQYAAYFRRAAPEGVHGDVDGAETEVDLKKTSMPDQVLHALPAIWNTRRDIGNLRVKVNLEAFQDIGIAVIYNMMVWLGSRLLFATRSHGELNGGRTKHTPNYR